MSTSSVQQAIIYGLGEGALIADSTMLAYALRWANRAYRELYTRVRLNHINLRSVFRTVSGQQTYQTPINFIGFLTLKDESNNTVLNQITPEEFARDASVVTITNETLESNHDVAVSLSYSGILQYSETVQNINEDTTYTRDSDYTMAYTAGTITVLSTGSMADATDFYIDYSYYAQEKPTQFCLEYDAVNAKYVLRLDPVPDDIYVMSLAYPSDPSALSSSVDPVWAKVEFALECGGIYYGSLELVEDAQKRMEFKGIYETAMQALIQLNQDLVPKHDRIKTVMKRSDY